MSKNKTILITCGKVDTPDGTPIRDYIDVEDLVAAHYMGYEYLVGGGKSELFNLGNGKSFSVTEIVSEVEKCFDVSIPKKNVELAKVSMLRFMLIWDALVRFWDGRVLSLLGIVLKV